MSMRMVVPVSVFASLQCLLALGSDLVAVDSSEFQKIFSVDAKVHQLAPGLGFLEGPIWFGGRDGYLVFSDIPANQLKKWSSADGLATFRSPSNNANGNTLGLQGRLVTAEHGARRISVTQRDGTVLTVVDRYQGKRFNSPNDVIVKSDGTIWFSDPDYGLAGRPKEQPGNYVYRFDPLTDALTVVAKDFVQPNGLCFSPDESQLYIADSGSPRHIRVFRVRKGGTLGRGRVFARLDRGGPDGIRCDEDGRIWSSSGDGAQVFSAAGKLIARVVLPKAGANLCFGGADGRTLFITARDTLHAVKTRVRGAVRR